MIPITYALNIKGSASETYYPDIEEFTDEVLALSRDMLKSLARELHKFIVTYRLEKDRTIEE